jgi:hypothetical protein
MPMVGAGLISRIILSPFRILFFPFIILDLFLQRWCFQEILLGFLDTMIRLTKA